MIGRLFYHWFWNFYDFLGTYVLAGVVFTLLITGGIALTQGLLGGSLLSYIAILLFCFIIKTITLSGLLPFASMAARGVPVRLPDFFSAMKSQWKPVAKMLALQGATVIVFLVGIRFYGTIGNEASGTLKSIGTVLAIALMWGLTFLTLIALAVWGGMFTPDGELNIKSILKRGFLLFMLKPGIWFSTAIAFAFYLVISWYSKIGFIFLLPVLMSMITTSAFLVEQYAGFLTDAKQELGDALSLSKYKRRAIELGIAWEAKQPKRTLRELIKPWEM